MAITVRTFTGKDSSGRNTYSGSTEVKRQSSSGGGSTLQETTSNAPDPNTISARQTQAAIDKVNQQRIDAGKPTLVGTQPPAPAIPLPSQQPLQPNRPKPTPPTIVTTQNGVETVTPNPQYYVELMNKVRGYDARFRRESAPLAEGVSGPESKQQYNERQYQNEQKNITSPILNRAVSRNEINQMQAEQKSADRITLAKTQAKEQEYAAANPWGASITENNPKYKEQINVITQKTSNAISNTTTKYLGPTIPEKYGVKSIVQSPLTGVRYIGNQALPGAIKGVGEFVGTVGVGGTDAAVNYKQTLTGVRNTQLKEIGKGAATGVALAAVYEYAAPAVGAIPYALPAAQVGLGYLGIKYAESEFNKKPEDLGRGLLPNAAMIAGGVGVSKGVARVTRPIKTISDAKVTSQGIDTTRLFSDNPKLRSQSIYGSTRTEQTFSIEQPSIYSKIGIPKRFLGKVAGSTTEGTIRTDLIYSGDMVSKGKGTFDITGSQTITKTRSNVPGTSTVTKPIKAEGILYQEGKSTVTNILYGKKVSTSTSTKVGEVPVTRDIAVTDAYTAYVPAKTNLYSVTTQIGEVGGRQTTRLWSKPKVETYTALRETASKTKVDKGNYNYLKTEKISVYGNAPRVGEPVNTLDYAGYEIQIDPGFKIQTTGTTKTRTITSASETVNSKSVGKQPLTQAYKKGYSELLGTPLPKELAAETGAASKYMKAENRLGLGTPDTAFRGYNLETRGVRAKIEALKNKRLTLKLRTNQTRANIYTQRLKVNGERSIAQLNVVTPETTLTLRYGNKVPPELSPGAGKRIIVKEKPLGVFDRKTTYTDKAKPSSGTNNELLTQLRTRTKAKYEFKDATIPTELFKPELTPKNSFNYGEKIAQPISLAGLSNKYKQNSGISLGVQSRPTYKTNQNIILASNYKTNQRPEQIIIPEYKPVQRTRQDQIIIGDQLPKYKQDQIVTPPPGEYYGSPKTPFGSGFTAGVPGGGAGGRGSQTQRGGGDKFSYAPTFTAAFFGIKANKKQRKAILEASARGATYTGSEVIRPLL